MIYVRLVSSCHQSGRMHTHTHSHTPPSQRTGLEFSSSSETRSGGTRHALAPHFPVPEHTCEDKTSLIQRWDEWQHCFWVSVGRKEGTPGPRAQLRSAQRLTQCCCHHTQGMDKNTHAGSRRTGESLVWRFIKSRFDGTVARLHDDQRYVLTKVNS